MGGVDCDCVESDVPVGVTCDDYEYLGCDSSTHNCADLDPVPDLEYLSVGRESDQSGWCNDGIDNDCDGLTDNEDHADCPVDICSTAAHVGAVCVGNNFDLPNQENADRYYCDTGNPDGGNYHCCRVGSYWDVSLDGCREFNPCHPTFCPYDPGTPDWWSDSGCISADSACCHVGIQAGEAFYETTPIQSY